MLYGAGMVLFSERESILFHVKALDNHVNYMYLMVYLCRKCLAYIHVQIDSFTHIWYDFSTYNLASNTVINVK